MAKTNYKRGSIVKNRYTKRSGVVSSTKPFAVKTKTRSGKTTNKITSRKYWK